LSIVTWDDIAAAGERIAPYVHRTPVLTCSAIDRLCGAHVVLKCENFQKTGSFKFRGAVNTVLQISDAERARGVLTHSSGNHAQALAHAAQLLGVPVTVVMPQDAASIKQTATEDYGATVVLCPPMQRDREETAERIRRETGAVLVDSHDDPCVIAGQGTAVAELIDEVGELDVILAPLGGGGLLSGTLIAAKHLAPRARVIGPEPAGADDAYRSLQEGYRITDFTPKTIADGLRTPLGENTFSILRRHVAEIVLVSEREILEAMRTIWERMKIVIEPSSAVAVAPLLHGTVDAAGKRVGVILSGGNVDLSRFFADLEGRIAPSA
jgi:threonine dehydratase